MWMCCMVLGERAMYEDHKKGENPNRIQICYETKLWGDQKWNEDE